MHSNKLINEKNLTISALLLVVVRFITLGSYPLVDTTEARYAEIARKMVELNDWITPWFDYNVPFWGKPPLSFWVTACSFKLFGINEFAARLPHWLAAVFVLWLVWDWALKRSRREAAIAVVLLSSTSLFLVAAGAVMTDMMLTVGTMLIMKGFWLGLRGQPREQWLAFVGLSLALLAKGPLVLVLAGIPVLSWILLHKKLIYAWRSLPWMRGLLLSLIIACPWYILAEIRTPGFLNYFLMGEHWHRFITPGWKGDLYGSAHAFPRGSIWLFAIVGLIPWSFLLPILAARLPNTSTYSDPLKEEDKLYYSYLLLWWLTPCVFFTFAGNILWTYVLPGLPALILLTSSWLANRTDTMRIDRTLMYGVSFMFILYVIAIAYLKISDRDEFISTKYLITDYKSRKMDNEPLIFLDKRPYSASFYTEGKAEELTQINEIENRLSTTSLFIVTRKKDALPLPKSVKSQANIIAQHGQYELIKINSLKK